MKKWLKPSTRIALLYFVIGVAWISLSDYMLIYFIPAENLTDWYAYQLLKGLFYVLLTSGLLFILIERHSQRLRREIEETEELNKQLQKYARELEHSNEELQQFSYITSHDLQEPLRNISSFLKRLEQKCSRSIDRKAHRYIHYAILASDRMRRLIHDTLALHQVREHSGVEFESVNLNHIVQESLLLLRKQIEKKEACIIVTPLPRLLSNESLLIKLFHALMSNSLIYKRNNVPPLVHIWPEEHKHHWNIFVRDNGIGIDEKYKKQIFTVFRRLHAQQEFSEAGSGVGLAMAHKIVRMLGGNISLVPQPAGQPGATFCFSLPKDL